MTVEEKLKTLLDKVKKDIDSRQEYNFKLLDILSDIVENHPQLRFEQILYDWGFIVKDEDLFYEESKETYNRINSKNFITSTKIY